MNKPDMSRFDPMAASSAPLNSQQPTQHQVPPSGPPLSQQQRLFLERQGFTGGLIKALAHCRQLFPKRCWILDNSFSMTVRDSHRISGTFANIQDFRVTRWEELQDCVSYQVHMASAMQMPTRFALLNAPGPDVGPQYFSVGESGPAGLAHEIHVATTVMARAHPFGATPLCHQLAALRRHMSSIAPQLVANRKTVPVIIATQGLPTNDRGENTPEINRQFIDALSSFRGLPICILFRMCTDDERVFDFYNSIDARTTSLRFDVVDDFFGESLEVHLRNPWLTYALPLHRFRELGFYTSILDAIDERALTADELRGFCAFLFGSPLPHPKTHWNAFFSALSNLVGKEQQQWNHVSRKLTPWVNFVTLQKMYGHGASNAVPKSSVFSAPVSNQGVTPSGHTNTKPVHDASQAKAPASLSQKGRASPLPTAKVTPSTANADADNSSLKKRIQMKWALVPPAYKELKPFPELLGTIQTVLPDHDYFQKWKPLSLEALDEGEYAVLKRANRKIKVLLHPDKLPRDLSPQQLFVSKLLWAILADAWQVLENAYVKAGKTRT